MIAATAATGPQQATVFYTAPKGGFTMAYPRSWQQRPGDCMLTLAPSQSPGIEDHLIVDVPPLPWHLPGMITLDRVADGYIADMKKRMQEMTIQSSGDQMLDGAKARRIHATAKQGGKPKVIDAVLAVRNDTVYVLSAVMDAAKENEAHAAMDQVVSSWKWTGK